MTPLRLVPLWLSHRAALLQAMSDPEILRFTRTPHPMPDGWLDRWMAEFDQDRRYGWAVVDEDVELLGYAVTGVVDRVGLAVELGYAVAPGARGRGVATETLRQLTRWAFDEGMLRVTALISVDNPASSRVAEKVGYSFEGVLRSVHHVGDRRGDLQSWSILPGEMVHP